MPVACGATQRVFESIFQSQKNSFRIKTKTGEDMGQFYAGSVNKAVPSFR